MPKNRGVVVKRSDTSEHTKQFAQTIRRGEQQVWCWEMAQAEVSYRRMVPLFIERWGEKVSIATISHMVRAEIEHQRSLHDRSADVMRQAATDLLERNNAIRLELIAEARKRGSLVAASSLLDGSDRNILEKVKLHGAQAPVLTKAEIDVTTHEEQPDTELDELIAEADLAEEQMRLELHAAS